MKRLLTITTALVGVIAAAQTGDPDEVVATINGEKLLAGDYFQRMEFLPGVGMVMNGQFTELPPAFLTLQRAINDELIFTLARTKGVLPTAAETDAELAKRKAANPDLFAQLATLGVAEEEIRRRTKVELAQFKLLTQGVTVTDAQVDEHYKVNPQMYTVPAKIKLRVIVVRAENDKIAVDNALENQTFDAVARQYSVDVTKYEGGNLPLVPIANLPQAMQDSFKPYAAGTNTDWIESGGSWLKYRIENKTENLILPLDNNLREAIRTRLLLDIGRNTNRIQDQLDELRKTAVIEFKTEGLKRLYEAYMREYFSGREGGGN